MNPTDEERMIRLRMTGAALTGAGRQWVITGRDKWARNAPGQPREVDIEGTSFLTGAENYTVPPLSICLRELPVR